MVHLLLLVVTKSHLSLLVSTNLLKTGTRDPRLPIFLGRLVAGQPLLNLSSNKLKVQQKRLGRNRKGKRSEKRA